MVRCSLLVVRCSFVRCLLFVDLFAIILIVWLRHAMFVRCYALFGICCLLCVVCCVLFVVICSLVVACCSLFAVCCSLF